MMTTRAWGTTLKNKMISVLILLSTVCFISLINSCGQKDLQKLGKINPLTIQTTAMQVEYCTKEADSESFVYNIYVVDRSASNNTTDSTFPTPRARRYGGLLEYIQGAGPANPKHYHGIVEFFCGNYASSNQTSCRGGFPGGSGSEIPDPDSIPYPYTNLPADPSFPKLTGQVYVPTAQNGSQFMTNLNGEFTNVIQTLIDTPDPASSGTPYSNTFKNVYSMIREEMEKKQDDWEQEVLNGNPDLPPPTAVVNVVFVTDGVYTDMGINTVQQYLYDVVENIMKLPQDSCCSSVLKRVRISSAFYHLPTVDPAIRAFAEDTLQQIAEIGRGIFISFVNGERIDYQALLFSPVVLTPTLVTQLFVTNINGKWDNSTLSFQHDSDADGISDNQETKECIGCVGEFDSDKNGYRDGLEKMMFGKVCNLKADKKCNMAFKNVDDCTIFDTDGVTYKDDDKDGLNDCEELLAGSFADRYDSRNQGVTDYRAFLAGIPFVKEVGVPLNAPYDLSGHDPDSDFRNSLIEIKENTPPELPDYFFNPALKPTKYIVTPFNKADLPGSICYRADIKDLPYFSDTDTIGVWLELKEKTAGGRKYRSFITKSLVNGSLNVTVEDINSGLK
jgi:hypothetical protein